MQSCICSQSLELLMQNIAISAGEPKVWSTGNPVAGSMFG